MTLEIQLVLSFFFMLDMQTDQSEGSEEWMQPPKSFRRSCSFLSDPRIPVSVEVEITLYSVDITKAITDVKMIFVEPLLLLQLESRQSFLLHQKIY